MDEENQIEALQSAFMKIQERGQRLVDTESRTPYLYDMVTRLVHTMLKQLDRLVTRLR